MGHIPSIKEAEELLYKYNKEEFHMIHGRTVSSVMKWFASKHDKGNEEFWGAVGMLHDIDYEQYPNEHCVKGIEIMNNENIDESLISSALSHGYGLTKTPYEPKHIMEKILFAVDELTGLIWAAALVRPSKSVLDIELKSIKKKFKDKSFAAGCSRDAIKNGADLLGWELDELINETLLAMKSIEN